MEDSVGYELFLRRCLSDKEFDEFIGGLDNILSKEEEFREIRKKCTILHVDDSKESKEAFDYLKGNFPQFFITQESNLGLFLDIVGFGLRKRIEGLGKIKLYVDKMKYYAEQYGLTLN